MRFDKVSSTNPHSWTGRIGTPDVRFSIYFSLPTNRETGEVARMHSTASVSRHRTLTKAQTFSRVCTREIVKFPKPCVRFRYTLTHRGFRAPLETSIPNGTTQKFLYRFDFYTRINIGHVFENRRWRRGIFIESRENQPWNLEDVWPNANRFHWNILDKTCLFLSSREIYNLLHHLSTTSSLHFSPRFN